MQGNSFNHVVVGSSLCMTIVNVEVAENSIGKNRFAALEISGMDESSDEMDDESIRMELMTQKTVDAETVDAETVDAEAAVDVVAKAKTPNDESYLVNHKRRCSFLFSIF